MIRLGRLAFEIVYVGVACLIILGLVLWPFEKLDDQCKEKQ
jgi:hypothetical protein